MNEAALALSRHAEICLCIVRTRLICVLLGEYPNRLGVRVLAGACELLSDSCGHPKLSRRDADDPLEVRGKMALVREAGAECDLSQAEIVLFPQELLRSFNPAPDYVLVRRQSGGRPKLPGKVIGAEMGDGSHLLQRRTVGEVFHDVLDDAVEFAAREYAVRRRRPLTRSRDMTDQVNAQ